MTGSTKDFCPGSWPVWPMKVAIPSDLAQLIRSLYLSAAEIFDPKEHAGTCLGTCHDLAESTVDKYMEKHFDGAKLLDLPADKESKLRHLHNVDSEKNLATLFYEKLSLLPRVFEHWDPKKTILELDEDDNGRRVVVFFRDWDGEAIIGVTMPS